MQTLPFAQASTITAEEIINVIPDLRIHWEDLSLDQHFRRIRQRRSTSPKIMIVNAISSVVSHYSCYFHSPSEIALCLQTLGCLSHRCLQQNWINALLNKITLVSSAGLNIPFFRLSNSSMTNVRDRGSSGLASRYGRASVSLYRNCHALPSKSTIS